jgi:RNA polymerase sigma factor (sigma-70 family)
MALGIFSNKTDQVLVQRYLRRRDERSFRDLYQRHTPAMYALALRLTNREAAAEDALQDAWIRACRSLAEFQWKSSLRTWLTGILINCVRDLKIKHAIRNVSMSCVSALALDHLTKVAWFIRTDTTI